MKKLIVFLMLFAAVPAAAWDGAGWDTGSWNAPTITGPLTLAETTTTNVIADADFNESACGTSWTCSGAWALGSGVATRTANASNLALVSATAVDEGANGTWYRWDIATNLTAGTLTPSFCGQTLTAISTTGALTTTYRLFCPYQAAALGAPTLTAVAATAGTVLSAPLYPITSEQTGTGLEFRSTNGEMHFVLGAAGGYHIWPSADGTTTAVTYKVHGYDDAFASYIGLYVSSTGTANVLSSGAMSLTTSNNGVLLGNPSGTGDFSWIIDKAAGSLFQIGDNTYAWDHAPGTGIEDVVEIDGKAWLDGGANVAGQVTVSGTAPAIGTCGTTPAIASGSTDHAGLVTVGSGATTACTLTFAVAYANEPACVVSTEANVTAYISAKSVSAMTVTFSADAASQQWDYVCFGL